MYTVLTGQDRTKGKVCDAIHTPLFKKDVKKYYEDVVGENVYKTAEVSEIEIQRIISYYKNQNGNTDKIVVIYAILQILSLSINFSLTYKFTFYKGILYFYTLFVKFTCT